MNDFMTDLVKDGLVGLRQLLAGKHLRPADLALTIVAVQVAEPERILEILSDTGKQSRWEAANGEEV